MKSSWPQVTDLLYDSVITRTEFLYLRVKFCWFRLYLQALKSCHFRWSVFPPAAASLSPSSLLLLICEGPENPRELNLDLHADGEHTGWVRPKRETGAETENAELLGVWHLFKDLSLWRQRRERVFGKLEDSVKYGESVTEHLSWWFSLFTGSCLYSS